MEDQVFFIYNHNAVQSEEDDPSRAILYFFPSSVSMDEQCALCGQLMGIVKFFQSYLNTSPQLFVLHKNKLAVQHLGKYTMVLSGNRQEPDGVVLQQLKFLFQLFTFYQCCMNCIEQRSVRGHESVSNAVQDIWDSYLPFVRRYGDSMAAAFNSLPTVQLPKVGSLAFLRSCHLLQSVQAHPGVLAGCIIYRNRVLCSQLPPDVTARLLIIRPQQTHFPCRHIPTDFELPEGVRLVKVLVSQTEYLELCLKNHGVKGQNLDRKVAAPGHGADGCEAAAERRVQQPVHAAGSPTAVMSRTCSEPALRPLGDVVTERSPPRPAGESVAQQKQAGHVPGQTTASDSPSQNETGIPSNQTGDDDLGKVRHSPSPAEATAAESSHSMSLQSASMSNGFVEDHEEANKFPNPSQPRHHAQSSELFRNVKKLAAQNKDMLGDMTKKLDLSDSEDTTVHLARSPSETVYAAEVTPQCLDAESSTIGPEDQQHSPPGTSCPVNEAGPVCHSDTDELMSSSPIPAALHQQPLVAPVGADYTGPRVTTAGGEPAATSERPGLLKSAVQATETPAETSLQDNNCISGEHGTETATDNGLAFSDSNSQQTTREAQHEDFPPGHAQQRRSSSSPADSGDDDDEESATHSCLSTEEQGKKTLDLYIQGNSDTLLLLLLEQGQSADRTLCTTLWRKALGQLAELEGQLKQQADPLTTLQEASPKYNFLTHNSWTRSLSGKISVSHGMLQPMSAQEMDFCSTAVMMHQEFEKSPSLTDITLRSQRDCVYGHTSCSQQVYFQPKEASHTSGAPSARDSCMNVDATACIELLKDQGINII